MRIVSLLPAATELIEDLGLGAALVGQSGVARPVAPRGEGQGELPLVAGVPPHQHQSRFVIDRAALLATRPDVIVLEERCPVCLAAYEGVVDGLATGQGGLEGHAVRLISFAPRRLEDALASIVPLATLLGQPERGQALLKMRSARLLALSMHVARYLVRSARERPRVALIEMGVPMRTPGRWVPDLIDAAGGIPVLVEAGDDSAAVLPDAVAEARPEVLLLAVPDDPQARAAELTGLLAQAPWSNLPARHLGRTWALRFDGLFRHGNPRLVEGVEVLVRIITPEALGANGTPPAAERALLL